MSPVLHWFEIPVIQFERAVAFYQQVLQVALHEESFDNARMALFPKTDDSCGGALLSSPQARPHVDGVRVYLDGGADLDATLERVKTAGGIVVQPKTRLPETWGHIALFSDLEGNLIGLHSAA
ncbi:VOC family protein [Chromobacterium haemolyticum]|uniref:VOC family protein n=1 Tax=Chromobacterium haemolyticum TaxID=394935 RepID=UPI000DEEF091|nr:VOC family protein [Chromobacterium haemolyticum]